jgi:transcriptional regulator with XRE-family HTH domain
MQYRIVRRTVKSQLSKYERGLILPPAEALLRVKQKLKVSVDWLNSQKLIKRAITSRRTEARAFEINRDS